MKTFRCTTFALFACAWFLHCLRADAQNIQSPESPNFNRDCVLGDWPTPQLPCDTSLEIMRSIKVSASGSGKPCPIETKTVFGPHCTPTPTVSATATLTAAPTKTPTATPTVTVTPTVTLTITAGATPTASVTPTATVTRTPTVTPTPTATATRVNYCAGKSLSQIQLPNQKHDGQTFVFNPSRMIYDKNKSVWFDNQGASTFVCAYNSGAERYPDSNLVYNFGHRRSGASAGDQGGRIAFGKQLTDSLAAEKAQKSCFICGLVRWKKGCFPPGVLITMGDGVTTKKVEDIAAGDMVWNPTRREAVRVIKVSEGPERKALVRVKAGPLSVTMSREHPVAVGSGWKQAQEIRSGDIVRDAQGREFVVEQVLDVPPSTGLTVINFVLERGGKEGDGLLIADSMVVGDLLVQRELAGKK